MAKVRILFAVDTFNASCWLAEEVRAGLTNGNRCYYEAGTVDVDAEVEYVGEDAQVSYAAILRAAFDASQNDAVESEVTGYEGGMPKFRRPQWNGEFPQRSSCTGDLFVIEQVVFKADGDGFRFVCGSLRALDKIRGVKLALNPDHPCVDGRINGEFDSLITD